MGVAIFILIGIVLEASPDIWGKVIASIESLNQHSAALIQYYLRETPDVLLKELNYRATPLEDTTLPWDRATPKGWVPEHRDTGSFIQLVSGKPGGGHYIIILGALREPLMAIPGHLFHKSLQAHSSTSEFTINEE